MRFWETKRLEEMDRAEWESLPSSFRGFVGKSSSFLLNRSAAARAVSRQIRLRKTISRMRT